MIRLDLPRKAVPRAKPAAPLARNYAGAQFGRLTADWWPTQVSADRDVKSNALALRNRARDLRQNWPYASRFTRLLETNVAGKEGIQLEPRVLYKSGPKAGELWEDVNAELSRAWRRWCRAETCTADGKFSFAEVQHLWARTEPTDGEFIVRLLDGFDNEFGFAIQVIDADQLDVNHNGTYEGREIRMGVEINQWGRAVAYWLLTHHPMEPRGLGQRTDRLRVPAEDVVYLGMLDRPGQTRGVTWFHSVLLNSRMLDGYWEAELTAARIGASAMGFVTPDPEHTPADPNAGGPGGTIENLNMEPGTFWRTQPGEKVTPFSSDHPSTAFGDFSKHVLRGVATGLHTSYNTLAGDWESVSFASLRHGKNDERDVYELLQCRLAARLCNRVYERWLRMAMAMGAVKVSGFDPRAYMGEDVIDWTPRTWPYINPTEDVATDEAEVRLGTNSRTQIMRKRGRKPEQIWADLDKENQKADEYGIDINGLKATAPPPQPAPADAPADDSAPAATQDSEGKARRRLLQMVRSQSL